MSTLIVFISHHFITIAILVFGMVLNIAVNNNAARKSIPPVILDWFDHTLQGGLSIASGLFLLLVTTGMFTGVPQYAWAAAMLGSVVGMPVIRAAFDRVANNKKVDDRPKVRTHKQPRYEIPPEGYYDE